jgi:tRNA G18 (ribose-2'-O)-methylase SpoU
MPVIHIERIDDPRLDDYRNVSDPELLRRSDLFVGEGRLVVRRLLSSGHGAVSLLLNEASFKHLEGDFQGAFERIPVYVGSTPLLAGIVGFNFHRGCLALARRPTAASLEDVTRDARLLLVLQGVTDPDNVGSAFRNAAAFGADGVLLNSCSDPLYRKAVRTSVGHVLQMSYAHIGNLTGAMAALKSAGFTVVALTPAADATPLADCARALAPVERIALLAGGEADGLSAGALAAADARARIPMHRGVDSLNLSTAIGIALDRLSEKGFREPFSDA